MSDRDQSAIASWERMPEGDDPGRLRGRLKAADPNAREVEARDVAAYLDFLAGSLVKQLGPTTVASGVARQEIRSTLVKVWRESRRFAPYHRDLQVPNPE